MIQATLINNYIAGDDRVKLRHSGPAVPDAANFQRRRNLYPISTDGDVHFIGEGVVRLYRRFVRQRVISTPAIGRK